LHQFHISEYQALSFYHAIYPGLRHDLHIGERTKQLKKRIGGFGAVAGKEFCRGVAEYYEAL
jgi:hypothetical protein